ncbi:serine hydrolase domain-containing protein [Parvularcula sp. LCG005]|uniref:serine hydrolase domain-containing protein n=1 Tax=Parvularcula sp. LCG005 TaxID=3078805 RepID=UPI002942CA3E|nr:serine hydrolase domain-containing protein [Parvularcula sp. LCG005]WOI52922.1 serine hydrolase domain-containing protein [Parvularcula sp. LCG005]
MHEILATLGAALMGVLAPAAPQNPQDVLAHEITAVQTGSGVVGLAGAVMQDGRLVAMAASGERALGSGEPVSAEGPWHVGSLTKSMTAVMIATMVEDGLLTWDTTLADIYGTDIDPSWHAVTMTDLLTHRSGAGGSIPVGMMLAPRPTSREDVSAQRQDIVRSVLNKPAPGQRGTFTYSNMGVIIAGAVTEKIAGHPWEDEMESRVFRPLGLQGGFGAPMGDDAPRGHRRTLFMRRAINPTTPGSDNPPFLGPAGTVHMPLPDLVAYGQFHLSEQPGILSRETLDQLHQAVPDTGQKPVHYAYGWVVEADGHDIGAGPVIWHNGSNTMWYALLILFPERDTVMAFTANEMTDDLQGHLFDIAETMAKTLDMSEPAPSTQAEN